MKIGITCYPTMGGSGILATRLGVEFANRGHEVHFITYERPVALGDLDHENVHVHKVNVSEYPLFRYPPYTVALASEMAKVSKENGLDLIHAHYAIPHSTAALLNREMTGTPYAVTLHGSDVTILGRDPSYRLANSHSVNSADAVTAVSKFMEKEARERIGIDVPITVIPNFVDTDRYSPATVQRCFGGFVITHISNFRPVKRIQDLVQAMRIVADEDPTALLVLIGDGPERPRIESLVEELDLRPNVVLTGFRDDVERLLKGSDVLALSSETESAPLTILEGMSCGIPVIATNVGGIPELVEDGVSGYLVPFKSPEAIADRILRINSDPDLKSRLGETARRIVLERYGVEKVLSQYIEVYEGMLG